MRYALLASVLVLPLAACGSNHPKPLTKGTNSQNSPQNQLAQDSTATDPDVSPVADNGDTDPTSNWASNDERQVLATPTPMPGQFPGQMPGQFPGQMPGQFPGQTPPLPSNVKISNVVSAGAGCPAGSVSTNLASDGQAFTLAFSAFSIDAPAAKSVTTMGCRVELTLATPAGWQATVLSLDYRGFEQVSSGASASLTTQFNFAGEAPVQLTSQLPTPNMNDFEVTQTVTAQTWSACSAQKQLVLNVNAALMPGLNEGLLTVDSQDGALQHKVALAWRQCTP